MIKSKAIDIIQSFSPEEKSSFKDFLQSPYFNKKSKLVTLYELILVNLESLDLKSSSEEKVFSGLFTGSKFSYSFIRNLMSELLQLCELFLAVNDIKGRFDSAIYGNMIILKEYNRRHLDSLFKLKIKNYSKVFKKSLIDQERFDSLGKIESESIAFDLYRSSMEKVPLKVVKRSEYDLCNITQLLEFNLTDLRVNMSAYNLNFESELMFEFIKNLDIENYLRVLGDSDNPLRSELEIRLRLILLSIRQNDTGNYFKLRDLVIKNINMYTNSERSNMFIKLKNYCGAQIYNNDSKFYEEKYNLSKLESRSVKYNSDGVGHLYANVFIEVVQKAVFNDDIKFAKEYVMDFTKEIEKSKQESMYNLAMSYLEFHNKKFEKALEYLSGVKPFNNLVKNNCKILYLKTYYELSYLEAGFSALDSFAHYIKKKKEFTRMRREWLKKNYNIFNKLYKIKSSREKYSHGDLELLREEIKKANIYHSEWFFEKINELGKILKR